VPKDRSFSNDLPQPVSTSFFLTNPDFSEMKTNSPKYFTLLSIFDAKAMGFLARGICQMTASPSWSWIHEILISFFVVQIVWP